MAILSGIPVLNCHSIEDTQTFYQQLLQFVVVNKRESEGRLDWVHMMHGDTTLMLQAIQTQNTEPPSTADSKISLYYFVNNIKELHRLVKAKNHSVSELEKRDYQMQEFSLKDPEGNTVIIGQKS